MDWPRIRERVQLRAATGQEARRRPHLRLCHTRLQRWLADLREQLRCPSRHLRVSRKSRV